ncbi:MAG TPA: 50S ribosomal protein L3 N(5)-glutamine methyltransferase [Chromatiales bacterium]|nr:50S ribosomal protein L3 N(5)-glutamine methyltransferase [Chromatiales bacterium]
MLNQETDALATILDLIRWGASRFNEAGLFFGHGTDNAIDEAAFLVLHTLHLPNDLSSLYLGSRVTATERHEVLEVFTRRIEERVPAAYLVGEAWFAGLPFYVNPQVLVPRSPIAELIEQRFQPWIEEDHIESVLDLCTGSGCIGISIAVWLPGTRVDLADISQTALEVAKRNVARHGLEGRVQTVHSDLFSALKGRKYDIMVSNPPYVGEDEMARLPTEYHREPALGLAAGAKGLDVVERILAEAGAHLNPGGILVVEVGNSAEALAERYPAVPFLWLDFERGGEGVFLLTEEQIRQHQEEFERVVKEI